MDEVVQAIFARRLTTTATTICALRITEATRSQPAWVEVEVCWENLGITWQTLLKHLAALIVEGLADVRERRLCDPTGPE